MTHLPTQEFKAHVDYLRATYVQFLHPIAGDRHAIVIRNDLDSRFDPFMFWNPLAPSGWFHLHSK